MAKRPNDIMNWAGRQFDSFGPYLSIETGNPEMGMKGATFWCIHGTNASGDQSSMSMNASGDFNIMNDGQISITGGKKIDGGGGCKKHIATAGGKNIIEIDDLFKEINKFLSTYLNYD